MRIVVFGAQRRMQVFCCLHSLLTIKDHSAHIRFDFLNCLTETDSIGFTSLLPPQPVLKCDIHFLTPTNFVNVGVGQEILITWVL